MTKFGDFTLLEDLGRSALSDRYKAMHATQGGPFFLKVYSRLDPQLHGELLHRCESLIGKQHPNLARHLGHGVIEGLPFVVAPYLDGIDLQELATSLKDRRVVLGMDAAVLVLVDLATAVEALHQTDRANGAPNGTNGHASDTTMAHGDVSIGHVRVGADGQVWLTGLTTPRMDHLGKHPDARWDLAGVGALLYDLVPLLRSGGGREPLPVPLDRAVRRALGIGPRDEQSGPADLIERLQDVSRTLALKPDRAPFAELVKRTLRAVEKKLAETAPSLPSAVASPGSGKNPRARSAADLIPSLDPVDRLPTLEPIELEPIPTAQPARAPVMAPVLGSNTPPKPTPLATLAPATSAPVAPMVELIPIPTVERPAVLASEHEAMTQLVQRAPQRPPPSLPKPTLAPSTGLGAYPPAPNAPPPAPPPIVPARPPPVARTPMRGVPAPNLAGGPTAPTPGQGVAMPRLGTPIPASAAPSAPPPLPAGLLPPDLDEPLRELPARAPTPAATPAPPMPPKRPALAKKPLLADPEPDVARTEPKRAAANPALQETTRDSTDPDQKVARAEQVRRDPAVRALLDRGVIAESAVDSATSEHLQRGGRVIEILVSQGATTDDAVATALSAAAGVQRLSDQSLTARRPSPLLAKRLPQTYLLARRVLPLSLDLGRLVLAVADPFDTITIDELKGMLAATSVETLVAARAAITASTVEVYRALGFGAQPHTQGDSPTILVCTADEAKATRIGGRLVQEGLRVEHVVDGEAAMDILRKRPPSAVVCAHDLPGQNAQTLLLFAREQQRTAETPFFVLGPRDDTMATRFLDLGADDYFGEPLRLEMVLAKVRRAVGKGVGGRASSEGGPLNETSGIFSTPPTGATPVGAPPTAPTPQPRQAPVAKVAAAQAAPPFLDSLALQGLDDLPELPPDFAGEEAQPAAPAMPTGVMGTLRQMPVPEIVQSLEMGRKTARVDLVPSEGEKGMIAFEQGQIRYAECGPLRGDDAFYKLAHHKEGFFRIHYGDKPPSVNIEAPTTFLLLEAMRRMDEEGHDPSQG